MHYDLTLDRLFDLILKLNYFIILFLLEQYHTLKNEYVLNFTLCLVTDQ